MDSYKLTQANPGPNPNASEIVTAIHLWMQKTGGTCIDTNAGHIRHLIFPVWLVVWASP